MAEEVGGELGVFGGFPIVVREDLPPGTVYLLNSRTIVSWTADPFGLLRDN